MARQVSDEEFTQFVHVAWPGLYRTAYLLLGDPALAEDLVQTALEVYDLDSGSHVPVDGAASGYGWTTDGDLFSVSAKGVEECAGTTGECTTTPLAEGVHLADAVYFVRMAGTPYES
jgi:hypothetical protein